MIARRIAGANTQWGPPDGWDASRDGHCGTLFTRLEGKAHLSAWEPTPAELKLLNQGGSVVLAIVGVQPPVSLTVAPPVTEDRNAENTR